LAVVTCPLACDFEPTDVALDPRADQDAEPASRKRDAESEPLDQPDTGPGGRGTPPIGGSGGIDDPGGPTVPPPDPIAPMDSGTDARPELDDAQTDAPVPDGDLTDEDTSVDEDDTGPGEDPGGPQGPCHDGTFRCIPAEMAVIANFTTRLLDAEVTASCAGHTFETIARNGPIHRLMLPVECPLWLRATADGYWDGEQPIIFGSDIASFEGGGIAVYSTDRINTALAPVQQVIDEKKGLVSVYVYPNIPGVGLTIGQPSDPSVVTDATNTLVVGNALLEGGNGVIAFANVEPGPLTLVPFGPPGIACFPFVPADYESKSRTATSFNLGCVAAGP
jgi:hypothetical protein